MDMVPDRASLTAGIVAAARAAGRLPRPLARALGVASLGLVDHVTLRATAIDAVVASAVEEGARQLVVLGAGLDDRAWRMPELAQVIVFEVDHPATQARKRRSARGAPPRARELCFVGVDFERDDLAVKLESAGHDGGAACLWIWEGVTPYLTPVATAATLDVVAARSASGSVLAMTYGTPELASFGRAVHRLVRPAFRWLGEPLEGLMEPDEAARLVLSRGFFVEDDAGPVEWARRAGRPEPWNVIAEHLLVATRR